MLALNPEFTYTGYDGQYYTQLLPSALSSWFVVILGQGYLSTSDKTYPTATIVSILTNSPFSIGNATWETTPSAPFARNPFLASVSASRSISLCQAGTFPLPGNPGLYPLEVYTPKRSISQRIQHICCILTTDRQFMSLKLTCNPTQTLQKLQQHYPSPLILLGTFRGTRTDLQALEQQFAYLRVQQDWLRFSLELEGYVMRKIYKQ